MTRRIFYFSYVESKSIEPELSSLFGSWSAAKDHLTCLSRDWLKAKSVGNHWLPISERCEFLAHYVSFARFDLFCLKLVYPFLYKPETTWEAKPPSTASSTRASKQRDHQTNFFFQYFASDVIVKWENPTRFARSLCRCHVVSGIIFASYFPKLKSFCWSSERHQ